MRTEYRIEKYSGVAQALHWLIAMLVIAQFTLIWTAEALPKGDLKLMLVLSHKSIGISVLALAVARIAWRFIKTPPAFPNTMSTAEQWSARITHWVLYALIFIMPLSGWLMSVTAGRKVEWFWLFTLPDLMNESEYWNDIFHELHEIMAWVLLAMAVFHVLATAWHIAVKKDGLLKRMLP